MVSSQYQLQPTPLNSTPPPISGYAKLTPEQANAIAQAPILNHELQQCNASYSLYNAAITAELAQENNQNLFDASSPLASLAASIPQVSFSCTSSGTATTYAEAVSTYTSCIAQIQAKHAQIDAGVVSAAQQTGNSTLLGIEQGQQAQFSAACPVVSQ